jgi:hypothetical protein
MVDDHELRERLHGAAAGATGAPDLQRVERRARILSVRRAFSSAVALAAGCALVAVPLLQLSGLRDQKESAAPVDGRTISFEESPGWYTEEFVPAQFGMPYVWAANVPFAASDLAGESPTVGYPDATIEGLPPDGIVMIAEIVVSSRNPLPADRRFPDAPLIFGVPDRNYEGQRPGTSSASASARVNGRFVHVAAYFGSATVRNPILDEANEHLDHLVVASTSPLTDELEDFGIRMEVPDDWNRLLYSFGGSSAELRAGTVPITAVGDTIPGRRDMTAEDVVIALSESGAVQDRFEPVELPIALRGEDECPTCEVLDGGAPPPEGHVLFARTFTVGNRRFLLYAEFGSVTAAERDLVALNEILATLEIDASGPLEPSDPGARPISLPPGPSFTAVEVETFAYDGIRLDVPAGWSAVAAPLEAPAVAPIVAAFGSWPLPAGGTCGPEPALEALPDDGALVWIAEHPAPSNRGDFTSFQGWSYDRMHQPMRWECGVAAPSRMDLWEMEDERFFEVHVSFGPSASPDAIAEVEALLSSLRTR